MTDPLIDVVIAVHDERRPIERAVASALHAADGAVRVTVVAHELDPDVVAARLEVGAGRSGDGGGGRLRGVGGDEVRVLPFRDGVRSPAGPMNHGLRAATGRYVTLLGSDDVYEPGAMAAYPRHLRGEADAVILPLRHQNGALLRNPLPRLGRRQRLDPARDRLFYRSAPLALVRRDILERRDELLTPGLATGEDLDLSSWLWATASRIDFPVHEPAYVIGSDAADRVTLAPRPAAESLAPVARLVAQDWVRELPRDVRTALAVKIARIHLFSSVEQRPDPAGWAATDLEALRGIAATLEELAPAFAASLTGSEAALWRGIRAGDDAAALIALERRRHTDSWTRRTLTRNPLRSLGRESMARRYLLYRFDRWGAS